jgi:uncharacterized membrane protein
MIDNRPPASVRTQVVTTSRLQPLDSLRGLIMCVMALDHANAFIAHAHPRPEFWSGPFPAYADALAFLTRFVTHLAAPGFFFLLGAGVTLLADARRREGWPEAAITRHLVIRGLLLMALQFLVENPAWQIGALLSGGGGVFPIYFGVLYGLGGAMILAAFFRRAPAWVLAVSGLAVLILPEILIAVVRGPAASPLLWLTVLPGAGPQLTVYYPILPWFGLAALGMIFGRMLLSDRERAYRRALIAGGVMLALFFVVRALGGFGNIRPSLGIDWIDFFNVVKYPPSLVFVLFTLGVDLSLLFLFSRAERWLSFLAVLGRSPLFFYVAHLYLYGLIGFLFFPNGTTIALMYPVWLAGLVVLYAACIWYGRFKHSRPANSVWRLA